MELFLHIGAHRTGTTAMQDMLAAQPAVLAGKGVAALVHAELEARVPGLARVARREGWESLRTGLENATRGARKVLISDENIIGDMGWNIRSGSFYWRARERLEAWHEFLGRPPRRIGLGIRGYESYWLSAHALELSYRPAPKGGIATFAAARDGMAAAERGWLDLVDDIRTVFAESELFVWPVEARLPVEEIAQHLVDERLALVAPPPAVNAAPAPGLIPAMEDKRAAEPGIGRAAMRAWLADQAARPFDGFTGAQSARMAARYEADIAALAANHAGAVLLAEPDARVA